MGDTGRYLYAITRPHDDLSDLTGPAGATGLDGVVLDVVEHDGLAAVVSTVDLAEFGEDGLRRNLERLDWLEEVARGHDAVVRAVASWGPTAPLRLATICLDDDAVRRRLSDGRAAFGAVLDRIEGRHEWSLKLVVPPSPRPEPRAAGPDAPRPSGAAYLKARKEAHEARQTGDREAARLAEVVHDAVASRVVASRRLAPQDPGLSGHEGTMVLNAAYLVEDDRGDDLRRLVFELVAAHPQVQVELQGPWPPYSFATLDAP